MDGVAPRLFHRGRISKPDSEQFLVSLNAMNVRLGEPASYDEAFYVAQDGGPTVYDASYLPALVDHARWYTRRFGVTKAGWYLFPFGESSTWTPRGP